MACNTKNPLTRDGVSQKQRLTAALDPSYAKVDERSLEDLLYLLVDYSKEINFFNLNNQPEGDWKLFLEKDISVIISLISKKDASNEKEFFADLVKIINDPASTESQISNAFKVLFDLLFSILTEVDKWYKQTAEGLGIQALLKRFIRSQLKIILEQLIAFYKSAVNSPVLFDHTFVSPEISYKIELKDAGGIMEQGLLDVWHSGSMPGAGFESWVDYYNSISADHTVFGPDRMNNLVKSSVKIKYGLNKFTSLFEDMYNVLVQIIDQAPALNEETLSKYASHEPHMGLLLSFLRLFRYAQDSINTITKRHLNFYYQQVLQLKQIDAVADKVHLLFELAKHVDSHKLEAATQLKAGKDNTGIEVMYQTSEENIYNKASIDFLKSTFIDKDAKWQIYASPISNSADGNGAEFTKDDPKWKAFGQSQTGFTSVERTMPDAEIGFAVSSPLLALSEGIRYIFLQITCKNVIPGSEPDLSPLATFYLSGEKSWVTKADFPTSIFYFLKYEKTLYALIMLYESTPAIVNYSEKLHHGTFDSSFPMLKITANPNAKNDYLYNIFKDSVIEQIKLDVYGFGLKNLILQNDNGVLNPSKPFMPFGAAPAKGSKFLIGNREVFSKNIDSLMISFQWHGLPATSSDASGNPISDLQSYYNYISVAHDPITGYDPTNADFKVKLEILKSHNWSNLLSANENISIFNSSNANVLKYITLDDSSPNLAIGTKHDLEEFTEYTVEADRGFIRLQLDKPNDAFGHKQYAPLLTKQAIMQSITLPVEPYTPQISEISLSYKSSETISLNSTSNFEKRTSKYFHILPFGHQEIHQKLYGNTLYMLPQFEHLDKGVVVQHNAEFYIGLSNLEPPQNLSILFKIAEGSADPSLSKQSVDWFYLRDNQWVKFEIAEILSDSTNGLLTTGIIKFSIPRAITNENTILDSGYYWIMAAVKEKTNAICDLMAVYPQAGLASFADNGNDPNFLATPLVANSISKLKIKEPEIKTVTQPYSSFGGKIKETDFEYYRRVSERLRHKERGIAIWDYERIILQEFPEVYKVKCINHSTYHFEDENGKLLDSEFAPGFVTLIVVPELKNQNAVNPLQPRVSLNTLDNIKTFVSRKISPFAAAKLKVINPLFEKIQVEFYVEFRSGFDRGFYEKQIVADIIGFLSPWAFEEGKDIVFGGKVHCSVILNFLEERPYVDFVTDFKMNHIISETNIKYDVEEAVATTARSVLVSYDSHIVYETSSCS